MFFINIIISPISCMLYSIVTIAIAYLVTWSGFEAAYKTVPWPSRGLHHFGKFLEPSDE